MRCLLYTTAIYISYQIILVEFGMSIFEHFVYMTFTNILKRKKNTSNYIPGRQVAQNVRGIHVQRHPKFPLPMVSKTAIFLSVY